MSDPKKADVLDPDALDRALTDLKGWSARDAAITLTVEFDDFKQAFGFMAQVALLAEKADHHPDWSNSYNRVEISLSTHDAGGVTAKDIDLAGAIDRLASTASGKR